MYDDDDDVLRMHEIMSVLCMISLQTLDSCCYSGFETFQFQWDEEKGVCATASILREIWIIMDIKKKGSFLQIL